MSRLGPGDRLVRAMFPDDCPACLEPIHFGDVIVKVAGEWQHAVCPSEVPCPFCSAPAGIDCVSQNGRHCSQSHALRRQAADRKVRTDARAAALAAAEVRRLDRAIDDALERDR